MAFKVFAGSTPGSPHKAIEDRYAFSVIDDTVCAVVADGVTQPKSREGVYPAHAAQAAKICIETVVGAPAHVPMSRVLVAANEKIRAYNEANGSWDVEWSHADRSCSTAAYVRCSEFDGMLSVDVASIGDAVVLAVMPRELLLINRDQLQVWRRQHRNLFVPQADEDRAAVTQKRLAWQREHVRNNASAVVNGEPIGFGTLDGNPNAGRFIEERSFSLPVGTKIIVASDALRVISSCEKSEDPSGYARLAELARSQSAEALPKAIINLIREEETVRQARRDDATVVVIEHR